jgi:hypothetical protein
MPNEELFSHITPPPPEINFMKQFITVYKLDDDKVDLIKIRRAI